MPTTTLVQIEAQISTQIQNAADLDLYCFRQDETRQYNVSTPSLQRDTHGHAPLTRNNSSASPFSSTHSSLSFTEIYPASEEWWLCACKITTENAHVLTLRVRVLFARLTHTWILSRFGQGHAQCTKLIRIHGSSCVFSVCWCNEFLSFASDCVRLRASLFRCPYQRDIYVPLLAILFWGVSLLPITGRFFEQRFFLNGK